MNRNDGIDRRALFTLAGAGGLMLTAQAQAAGAVPPSPVDTGAVAGGKVEFPAWRAAADTPSPPPPAPLPTDQRVGFAIVGLGRLALEEILPAFAQSMAAKPVALVSGSPNKMALVARQYGIPSQSCYSYDRFEAIRDDPAIQAAYIVLPNSMHREFCERAARAGKHVLTEKPMSVNVADAQAMVEACATARVKLMVAYRIQYEPTNRRVMKLVRDRAMGRLVAYHGVNTQTVAADGARQWRHKKAMAGGGSLFDIGLYCLNTARFLTGEEPEQVYATIVTNPDDPRFAEVEESVAFMLRFPSGTVANCFTSYGGRDDKYQRLNLEAAAVEMPNAFQYVGQRLFVTARKEDLTSHDELIVPHKNQFALELDHMADCVLTGRAPYTPGEEGVQDHRIMEAIYQSARTNQPVRLQPASAPDAFRGPPP